MAYELTLEYYLPVPPEKMMQLLTEPELIKAWGGGDAVLIKEPGGDFRMFDSWVKGEVKSISDKELVYTWKPAEWREDIAASEVKYILTEENGSTKIDLIHSNLPSEDEKEKHEAGWHEFFFGPIEEYILKHNV